MVADLVEKDRMGRAFAARNSVIALSTMAGFTTSSYTFVAFGYPDNYVYSFAMGSVITLLSALIFLAYGDLKRPEGVGLTFNKVVNFSKNIAALSRRPPYPCGHLA